MRFDVISLFPSMLMTLADYGVIGRALRRGQCQLYCWNPRDYSNNRQRQVDDRPYGGGPGMVMCAPPLESTVNSVVESQLASGFSGAPVIYLSAQGETLNHRLVCELATQPILTLLAGRYEGIDERVLLRYVDKEISVGDYVLSGGELPAMLLMDAVIRQLPGVLNHQCSAVEESFATGLLDFPHYTRPAIYQGMMVPKVLLSGNHADIRRWRLQQALGRTWLRRPDILRKRQLTKEEAQLLQTFQRETKQNFDAME